MKKLRFSHQFKKDFKRYRGMPKRVAELNRILNILAAGNPIPSENYPHVLSGEYRGCFECHIGPDFLLIWKDEVEDVIYVLRLGSHSELFD